MSLTKDAIRRKANELGIDLVGFVRWTDLEEEAPDYDKPSSHSIYLTTLIVLIKRCLVGVITAKDRSVQQYSAGRTAQLLEEEAAQLAYWLEEEEAMAGVLSAMIPDLRRQPVEYSCPAGQGSMLLRQAAVRAGLGSLGLNMMLLTPHFGPRVFISGVLTDLELKPDDPFEEELCLGLEECGRCASICPEKAIPTEARVGAPLVEYRNLDARACVRSCQPYGPGKMVEHLKEIFNAPSAEDAQTVARSKVSMHLFHNLTILKHGAFTGCLECEKVCPVGNDYTEVERINARQNVLVDGVQKRYNGDTVSVRNISEK